MAGSLSFDPAAEYYDRTRVTDAASLAPAIDLLDTVLPDGAVLEIGVGTGALAVPLTARGRPVIGLDLSAAMLAKLREKDPDRTVPVAAGDATRLPFGSGSFRGAYCRWVLHLIADWHVAVRELCRVVDRGGVQPTRTINLPSPRRCRALARDQHFVKVMPRDFVGQRLSGTGGLPG